MTKAIKDKFVNIILLVLLGLILFTPLGFYPRVFISRILSFSPSVVDQEDQLQLANYNWGLFNSEGKTFNLNEARGKVVIVNFWATWCPPCIAEMPSLDALYEVYGEKVVFLFVAHDEQKKVDDFLKKEGYNFPVYFEASTSPELLATKNIPTTYVISRDGNIVVKKVGAADWNSDATKNLLDDLLKRK